MIHIKQQATRILEQELVQVSQLLPLFQKEQALYAMDIIPKQRIRIGYLSSMVSITDLQVRSI